MKMNIAKWVGLVALSVSAIIGLSANADKPSIEYDQDVTPDVIFGSGNANGGFTTDRRNGIELGLRVKQRFPVPMNTFNSNADGSYSFPATDACPGFGFAPFPLCLATPQWSFEWSVNTDYDGSTGNKVGDFTYEIGLDADPGNKTNYTKFDPITPSLVAPAFDHAMGDNSTANGAGDSNVAAYALNRATMNVAQNSWNYEFFNNIGTSLADFNPAVDGNYVLFLRANDPVSGKTVAETWIQVLVGTAEKLPGQKKKGKNKK